MLNGLGGSEYAQRSEAPRLSMLNGLGGTEYGQRSEGTETEYAQRSGGMQILARLSMLNGLRVSVRTGSEYARHRV